MLKSETHTSDGMTIDEKIRYGMMAVGAASVVMATLGLHLGPLSEYMAGGAGD